MADTSSEHGPFCLSDVLAEEYKKLHGTQIELPPPAPKGASKEEAQRKEKERLDTIYKSIHGLNHKRSALCFSGGGIRSATVGLGVLQSLAYVGLLQKFDFLSTVSGGGYIGSWLSAWVYRHPNGIAGVCEELNARPSSSTAPEPPPIGWLRSYSNYLSPKLGWLSADSWTLIGTYLRNLILNWLVLIPILIAILALPRLAVALVHDVAPGGGIQAFVLWSGVLCAIASLLYIHLYRPGLRKFRLRTDGMPTGWERFTSQPQFLLYCLLPLVLSAFLFTTNWAWYRNQDTAQFEQYEQMLESEAYLSMNVESNPAPPPFPELPHRLGTLTWHDLPSPILFILGGAALPSISWVIAFFLLGRFGKDWLKSLVELGSVIAIGAAGGGLLWLSMDLLLPRAPVSSYPEWYGVLAVPAFLGVFLFAATLYIGISSRLTDDQDREWWGRSGSWTLLVACGWAGLAGLIVLAPSGLATLYANEHEWLVELMGGTAGILSALTAVLLGSSSSTSAIQETAPNRQTALRDLASKLAAPIFILVFLLFLAVLTSQVIEWFSTAWKFSIVWDHAGAHLPKDPWGHIKVIHNTPVWLVFGFILIAGLFGCLWAFFININKFSLHSIYRNRLIRAYLGASRREDYRDGARCPNQFTDFDVADNIQMSKLADQKPTGDSLLRPFHIVNIALNLVTAKRLDWQQRKAQSFTVSALHSGSWNLGYRNSKEYGRNTGVGRSISLGTALAISGAAASPNMGYHSSPVVSLLLTLFNVRLGWWLGNPGAAGDKKNLLFGRPTYQTASPGFAVKPLLAETFGKTDKSNEYVYLSDGGHFENLGLYEMVLRRCHFILIVDASCDPTSTFQDLGNAIRKIRVDQGIDIDINLDMLQRPDNSRYSRWHHAIGTIRYDKVDAGAPVGTLLYIKTSLTGDEPPDVEEYAKQHRAFPHESTVDQFFDESQFESYRRLGQHIGIEVLRVLERTPYQNVSQVCAILRSHWIANPPGIHDSFLRETQGLIELERSLRKDSTLARYDLELYPELKSLFGMDPTVLPALDPRATLHLCNEQIQLMENVCIAVKLDEFHAHPLNRGWMNLFRRWTTAAQFRAMWPTVRGTYSRPFVDFAETHLNLEVAVSVVCCVPPETLRASLLHEYGLERPHQLGQLTRALDRPLRLEGSNSAQPAIWLAVGDGSQPPKDCWGMVVAYEEADAVLRLNVWVRLAYRNLGIGTRLLEQALLELKRYNVGRALLVDLGPDNPSAKGFQQQKAAWLWFYEQAGFTRDRPDEPRLRMRKIL
jgi:GNAT superfamily N-acetyltransferase